MFSLKLLSTEEIVNFHSEACKILSNKQSVERKVDGFFCNVIYQRCWHHRQCSMNITATRFFKEFPLGDVNWCSGNADLYVLFNSFNSFKNKTDL